MAFHKVSHSVSKEQLLQKQPHPCFKHLDNHLKLTGHFEFCVPQDFSFVLFLTAEPKCETVIDFDSVLPKNSSRNFFKYAQGYVSVNSLLSLVTQLEIRNLEKNRAIHVPHCFRKIEEHISTELQNLKLKWRLETLTLVC